MPSEAVTVAENLNTKRASGAIGWAPQLRELLAFQRIAASLGTAAAVANLAAIAPEEDRPTSSPNSSPHSDRPSPPLTLGDQR